MFRVFSNRRRAREALLIIGEKYGYEDAWALVRDGLVYVFAPDAPDMETILFFGVAIPDSPEMVKSWENVEEFYQGEAIRKFSL